MKPGTASRRSDIIQRKIIAQMDKSGKILKVWDSILQVEKELRIDHSSVIKVCRGKRLTAGGYGWTYIEIK